MPHPPTLEGATTGLDDARTGLDVATTTLGAAITAHGELVEPLAQVGFLHLALTWRSSQQIPS